MEHTYYQSCARGRNPRGPLFPSLTGERGAGFYRRTAMLEVSSEIACACLEINACYSHQEIQPVPVGHGLYWLRIDGRLFDDMTLNANEVLSALAFYVQGLERGTPVGVNYE
jgi:hypothetical protein